MKRHLSDEQAHVLQQEIQSAISATLLPIGLRVRAEGACFDCFVRAECGALIEVLANDLAIVIVRDDGTLDMSVADQVFDALAAAIGVEVKHQLALKPPTPATVN